jgi:hypothetical protein
MQFKEDTHRASATIRAMNRWQFSMRDVLTFSTAFGVWIYVVMTLPAEPTMGGQIVRFAMVMILISFTFAFHKLFQSVRLSWAGSALMAGFIVALCILFLAMDNRDSSILHRWR